MVLNLISKLVLLKIEMVDPFEALLDMGLDPEWVFSFRQNLKKLVVRKEEKSREKETFFLQIIIQSFHDFIQQLICFLL